jgi:hypothetical protein
MDGHCRQCAFSKTGGTVREFEKKKQKQKTKQFKTFEVKKAANTHAHRAPFQHKIVSTNKNGTNTVLICDVALHAVCSSTDK